jgi:hypothetical protein
MPVMQNRSRGTNLVVTNTIVDVLGRHLGNPQVLRCPERPSAVFRGTRAPAISGTSCSTASAPIRCRVFGMPVKENGIMLFNDQAEFHAARAGQGQEQPLRRRGREDVHDLVEFDPAPH